MHKHAVVRGGLCPRHEAESPSAATPNQLPGQVQKCDECKKWSVCGILYTSFYAGQGDAFLNSMQVEYFLTVARTLNFTKASEELYVTQPAISRQIYALEKELGFTLFDRSTRTTKLTAAGNLYYDFFMKMRSELNTVSHQAREANTEKLGSVVVGCLDGWNVSSFFPKMLDIFRKEYPNIQLLLETRGLKGLILSLKNEQVDVVISLDDSLQDVSGVHVRELTRVPSVLLYSQAHPLASQPGLMPQHFQDEVFLVQAEEVAPNSVENVRRYCAAHGFEPKTIRQLPNLDSVLTSVMNGMGVMINDFWSRDRTNESFRFVRLNTEHVISIAWLKTNKNPSLPVFINELMFIFNKEMNDVPNDAHL